MVAFNAIPPYWKLPGTSAELDPSQAGTFTAQGWALLMGYRNGGLGQDNVPIAVASQADADALFGAGSMLSQMFASFFKINRSQVIYMQAIPAPTGTAATGTITVSNPPTQSGVLSLYIGSKRLQISIGQTDTTAQVATKINAAINAETSLAVTSAVATNVVTMTSKHVGVDMNDVGFGDTFGGNLAAEAKPAGLTLAYSGSGKLAGGTGTPDLTTAISKLGDAPFKYVALPFTDAASLALMATEYGFGDGGRWGWMRQSYGQVFSARRDTYSNLMTWGPSYNYASISVMAFEPLTRSTMWEAAATYAAQASKSLTQDPAIPLQYLVLDGIMPAPVEGRFNKTQLNALASNGLAIQATDIDGQNLGVPMILREQSQYQKNTQGQLDNAYELVTTLATLDSVISQMRFGIAQNFARCKLANDGTRLTAGRKVATPTVVKAYLIALYSSLERAGLVENLAAFKANLVVERSELEPNTLECYFPPDIINQLRRFNVRVGFRLQFPT